MMEKVVLVGAADMAMICHFYLTHDSPYEVAAFTVDRDFIKEETLCGLPVAPFEEIENIYPPDDYGMLVAISFSRANRTRADKYFQAKAKGYELISYISSKAVTWPDLVVGDNTLICEGSVVNPFVRIGNNVVIAGGFVGHHSVIEDHCFLAANSVVLGRATIEPYSVIGANATVLDHVVIARECIIGAGATVNRSTKEKAVYVDTPAELLAKSSNALNTLITWPRGEAARAGSLTKEE
jgi:sugar O-acyltransferase (sialic acid O-acetyltransferase NeuD family)